MRRTALAITAAAIILPLFVAAQATAPRSGNWEVLPSWGELPAGTTTWGGPSQAALAADGNIIVFRRSTPSFFVLTPEGKFVKSFGDAYRLSHGIRIDREGFIWITDNTDNFVQKLSPDGKIINLFLKGTPRRGQRSRMPGGGYRVASESQSRA